TISAGWISAPISPPDHMKPARTQPTTTIQPTMTIICALSSWKFQSESGMICDHVQRRKLPCSRNRETLVCGVFKPPNSREFGYGQSLSLPACCKPSSFHDFGYVEISSTGI